jgi:hypothetical protein
MFVMTKRKIAVSSSLVCALCALIVLALACGCGASSKPEWEPLGARCFGDPSKRMHATATWSHSELRGAAVRIRVALVANANRPSFKNASLAPYGGKVLSEMATERDVVVEIQPEGPSTRIVGFKLTGLECAEKNADSSVEVRVDWTGGTQKDGQTKEGAPLRATVSSPL